MIYGIYLCQMMRGGETWDSRIVAFDRSYQESERTAKGTKSARNRKETQLFVFVLLLIE